MPLEEGDGYIKVLAPRNVDPFTLEERFLPEEEFAQKLQEVLAQEEIKIEGEFEEREVKDILYDTKKKPALRLALQIRCS